MNKDAFLSELKKKLSGLPQEDIDERISFYSEMIDDHIEDGITEEDAVAGIGTVDSVVEQIMSEIPLAKLVKEKVKPKRSLKAWEIILLGLGAPVWVPLIIAAVAVILTVYIMIWVVVVCVYAVELLPVTVAIAGFLRIVSYLKAGNPAGALFSFGAGVACTGLAILFFFVCIWITKAVVKLTGRMLLGIKSLFVDKEA